MALNVELFRKVQEAITREAETFDMGIVRHWNWPDDAWVACATPSCIAGHVAFIVLGPKEFSGAIPWGPADFARRALGLSTEDFFTIESWPYRFRRRYERAVRPATRARAACDYIDWLIEREASHGTPEL